LHKAFLRYHDPENWPLLREVLKQMGRADLIGNSKKQLIPAFQHAGTGQHHKEIRRPKTLPRTPLRPIDKAVKKRRPA
jgi:hypothetical protein